MTMATMDFDPRPQSAAPDTANADAQTGTQVQANDGSTVNVSSVNPHYEADTRLMMYFKLFIPAFFSFCVISTCIYKIVSDPNADPALKTVWWSTLTGSASSWLPSAAALKPK
jgi:hypothetical protein